MQRSNCLSELPVEYNYRSKREGEQKTPPRPTSKSEGAATLPSVPISL